MKKTQEKKLFTIWQCNDQLVVKVARPNDNRRVTTMRMVAQSVAYTKEEALASYKNLVEC